MTLFGKCSISEDECNPNYKYRTFNGGCNNIGKPKAGASLTELPRLVPAEYEDNEATPRQKSIFRNSPLPNARLISSKIHERLESSDNKFSLMMMQWGQFIDHDFAHTPQYKGPNNENLDCRACDSAFRHLACYPILIPKTDRFYPQDNGRNRCMKFVRSLPSPNGPKGPRQQLNAVTHYLDGSQVYGSDICHAESLRDPGFKLKMTTNPASHPHSPRKDLLPMTPHKPECRAKDKMCFEAGDERVNEQPGLTMMHTLMVREHNDVAARLALINPHWDKERVFQETRKIVGALIQHITYNEFLPRVLGRRQLAQFELDLQKTGYYNGYRPYCSDIIFNEFASAAFRFGHSLIRSNFTLMSEEDMETGGGMDLPLRDVFENPEFIRSGVVIDNLVRGIVMTPMEEMDNKISEEVANHLFEFKNKKFSGLDLAALNIQRGRDHGIPGYNKYRQMCGLLEASDFTHLTEIPFDFRLKLAKVYRNPNDIDLFTGLLIEEKLPGAIVGPTLACLLGKQFRNLRQCDRFWYENGDELTRFSPGQLQEIRGATLSALLCRNCDQPGKMPRDGFSMRDGHNPMVHCSQLRHLDLSHWRE